MHSPSTTNLQKSAELTSTHYRAKSNMKEIPHLNKNMILPMPAPAAKNNPGLKVIREYLLYFNSLAFL